MDIKTMYETFMRLKNEARRQTFEATLAGGFQESAEAEEKDDIDMGAETWTSKR